MLPDATPAAAAIPPFRKVLLEMSCPNLISLQVINVIRSNGFEFLPVKNQLMVFGYNIFAF
jgi:hypothetical protein